MLNLFEVKDNFEINKNVKSRLIIGDINSEPPLLSVLVPCYSHPDFLEQTLISILSQRCSFKYEIVIVDNNHETLQSQNQKIVEKLSNESFLYYVNDSNIGSTGNWNRCVELARGKYFTFCHDDDILLPNALNRLVSFLQRNSDDDIAIIGSHNVIDENFNISNCISNYKESFFSEEKYTKLTMKYMLLSCPTNGCGALYKKDNFIKIGGYKIDAYPCFDYALNSLYIYKYGGVLLNEPTFSYRVSNQSGTKNCFNEIYDCNSQIWNNIRKVVEVPRLVSSLLIKSNGYIIKYSNNRKWNKGYKDNYWKKCKFFLSLGVVYMYKTIYC